jgi:hypothetical protein
MNLDLKFGVDKNCPGEISKTKKQILNFFKNYS